MNESADGGVFDCHVHLVGSGEGLEYGWLRPGRPHPMVGNALEPLHDRELGLARLRAEAGDIMRGWVHVFGATASPDPWTEVAWLVPQADLPGGPTAMLAGVTRAIDLDTQYRRWLGQPKVVGVRVFIDTWPWDRTTRSLLKQLAAGRLVANLSGHGPTLWQWVLRASRLMPELTVVVDHLGFPTAQGDHEFKLWRTWMAALGKCGNVHMKVSGLGTVRAVADLDVRAYLEVLAATFGPDRMVYGSNWPVDTVFLGDYATITAWYREHLDQVIGASDRGKVMGENGYLIFSAS